MQRSGKRVFNCCNPSFHCEPTPNISRGGFEQYKLSDNLTPWAKLIIPLVGKPSIMSKTRNPIPAEEAERQLRQRERQFAAILQNLTEGIISTDAQGRVTLLNPSAERLTGWPREEALGRGIAEVFPFRSPQGETNHPVLRALAEGDHVLLAANGVLRPRQGKDVAVAGTVSTLSGGEEDEPGAILVFRDVTQERQTENQVRSALKLESLGIMAGGLAHDFNNLLTPVLGFAGLIRTELPADSPLQPMVAQIEDSARRAADLVRQMLAYSGKIRPARVPVRLSGLVQALEPLLRRDLVHLARLVLNLGPDLPPVEADPEQMKQVILSLVANAAESLPEKGGLLEVRTGKIQAGSGDLLSPFLRQDLAPGLYVFLEVRDEGCGIPPDILAKIFDPFFTTKFTGRGLGLAAVLGIVRTHGGTIQVQSVSGAGTTLRLLFPSFQERFAPAAPARPPLTPATASKKVILVVDDEPAIRALTCEALKTHGFVCITAANGQEAIDRFTQEIPHLRGVLLDLTLPDLDGFQVLREIQALAPHVPVVLMSGFSADDFEGRLRGVTIAGFLSKPFTPSQLMEKWDQVFQSKATMVIESLAASPSPPPRGREPG